MGGLAYSKINEAFINAGFFIGMGAAIIEASSFGIPSIQAIEYIQEPICYGWFYKNEGFEIGAYIKGNPTASIAALLEEGLAFTEKEYEVAAEKSYQKAQAFAIDNTIQKFISFAQNADCNFVFHFPKWKRILLKMASQPFKLIEKKAADTIKK